MHDGELTLLGVLMILGAAGLGYGACTVMFHRPGRALAMVAGAVVLLGAALGLLHFIGRQGF